MDRLTTHRHAGTRRRAVLALVAVAGLLAAACTRGGILDPTVDADSDSVVLQQAVSPGLVQVIRLSPAEPAPGDTLRVVSVVGNQGDAGVQLSSRICGLDVLTDLHWQDPFVHCGGYSMQGTLAAGDSLREQQSGIIRSGPGHYTIRVRQLLEPEQWIEVGVTIRQ